MKKIKLTYQEAYDKIIQAYFRDEIQPLDPNFCFCGTLCNNSSKWYVPFTHNAHTAFNGYSGSELYRMEHALLEKFTYTEDTLFAGMSAALEVLKQIHRERGEDVDSVPAFTKRKLKSAL